MEKHLAITRIARGEVLRGIPTEELTEGTYKAEFQAQIRRILTQNYVQQQWKRNTR